MGTLVDIDISSGTLVDFAQVVSMVAALVAVWFAWQAVMEAKALRCEERIARLTDLIADVGEWGSYGVDIRMWRAPRAAWPVAPSGSSPGSGRPANPFRSASACSTSTGPSCSRGRRSV